MWIPIDKDVPPGTGSLDDDHVLITDGENIASADWLGDCFESIEPLNNFMYDNPFKRSLYIDTEDPNAPKVTHWMPLPKAPNDE